MEKPIIAFYSVNHCNNFEKFIKKMQSNNNKYDCRAINSYTKADVKKFYKIIITNPQIRRASQIFEQFDRIIKQTKTFHTENYLSEYCDIIIVSDYTTYLEYTDKEKEINIIKVPFDFNKSKKELVNILSPLIENDNRPTEIIQKNDTNLNKLINEVPFIDSNTMRQKRFQYILKEINGLINDRAKNSLQLEFELEKFGLRNDDSLGDIINYYKHYGYRCELCDDTIIIGWW